MKRVIFGRSATLFLGALCVFSYGSYATAEGDEETALLDVGGPQKIAAFRGSITVPENRRNPASRILTLRYVRLPTSGAKGAPPIVYLAGGPGASGIDAIRYRWSMFRAMSRYGDVIALDQRGTGSSNIVPTCRSRQAISTTVATSDTQYIDALRAALRECLGFWSQQGADLAGYNTIQNAQDLEALRRKLGADKLVLWGTSFGAALALAALKEMPRHVSRVVISSVRGLDQTLKLPNSIEPYLDRLQEAVNSQPKARAAFPDIRALIRRVHLRLEREPVHVKLKGRSGESVDYLFQRRDMQLLAVALIADPKTAASLLDVYLALDRGLDPGIDRILSRLLPDNLAAPGEPITLEAMPIATNIASGMSRHRRLLIYQQAKTAVFGRYLDQTLPFDGLAHNLDLGDAFRTNPSSNVPVLLFSGTLDGRIVIEDQRRTLDGLRNSTLITVENAGHNLLDAPTPDLLAIVDQFMRGQVIGQTTIRYDLPSFVPEGRP